jgi:neutral ceramidase
MPRLEVLGARAAELLAPLVRDIETHDSAALELVTRTFGVGRGGVVERPDGQRLYYLPPDRDVYPDAILFDGARAASPFDEFNTIGGAGLCGDPMGITFAPIVGSSHLGPYHSCIDLDTGAGTILSIFDIPVPTLPICDSVRATAAALRIAGLPGGDWLVLGIPGEPTAPFAHYLRERSPAGAERTLLIGYTDDYSGYMLTAEDWLSGGYECSTNIWGPREGEQVLDGVLAAAAIAWSPEREDPEAGTDRFDAFAFPPSDEVAATITSDHGSALGGSLSEATLFWPDTSDEVVSFTPTVERAVGVARFAFSGGDPAVDDPEVVVERQVAGRWLPLADRASSREGAVVLTYTPFPLESTTPSAHRYAATWQPLPGAPLSLADPLGPFGLELGSYRLCAQGRARAAAGVTGYAICSPPIEVVAATLGAQSTATLRGALLTVSATLTPAPGLRALRDSDAGPSDGPIPLAAPWTVVATRSDASTTTVNIDPIDGTASADLGPGAAVVSVEIRDPHGNGGALTP